LWALGRVYEPFRDEITQLVTETASEICRPQPLPKSFLESCPGNFTRKPQGFVSASLFPSYARLYRPRVRTLDTKPHRGVLSFSSNIRYPIVFFCCWNPIWFCQYACEKPSFIVLQETSLTTYRSFCHQQDHTPEPADVPPGLQNRLHPLIRRRPQIRNRTYFHRQR
jgi:hypothetical protein